MKGKEKGKAAGGQLEKGFRVSKREMGRRMEAQREGRREGRREGWREGGMERGPGGGRRGLQARHPTVTENDFKSIIRIHTYI